MIPIYNGILHSHKWELNNAICSDTDGVRDYNTSEVSQTEKEKYPMISPMW